MPKSKRFTPGTVVLTPFPFSDLSGSKMRPVVVLAEESPNSILVAFISSRKEAKKNKHSMMLSTTECPEIKTESYIRYGKIANLHKGIIKGKIGSLTETALGELQQKVCKLLTGQ